MELDLYDATVPDISLLSLPDRPAKPRTAGVTLVIDNGVPLHFFEDTIESESRYIDLVKFGWGTSLVTDTLAQKIACLRAHSVDYYFGGTLFEKFLSQHKLDAFYDYCRRWGCQYVEISNGTIALDNTRKARLIADFAREFRVLSEVGYKDVDRSQQLAPSAWIEYIQQDLEAGATKVITEARESGTSGIYRANGEVRYGLIEEIAHSGIHADDIIFEAPNKDGQVYFITRMGANVNLGNIAFRDVIPLETLRLGLRSDTLLTFS